MRYALLLYPHPNIRYRESLKTLATAELSIWLSALGVGADMACQDRAGGTYLVFECPTLTTAQWAKIAALAGPFLFFEVQGDALLPLDRSRAETCLKGDLPSLLKYKGKTNEAFTDLTISLALASSEGAKPQGPMTLLDPVCGRGTGPMCALLRGMDGVGVEIDRADVKELNGFFTRYLEFHKLKHTKTHTSLTARGKAGGQQTAYAFAQDSQGLKTAPQRLRVIQGDTALAGAFLGRERVPLVVADLPYGVQHAPQQGRSGGSFTGWLGEVLPVWASLLAPGGAMALSFNTFTLPRKQLIQLVGQAGLQVCAGGAWEQMEHWVEQAVSRDVVVAVRV